MHMTSTCRVAIITCLDDMHAMMACDIDVIFKEQ